MAISVIITHYAPTKNTEKYRNLLKQTISSIRSQNVNFNIEIIVCDDGSEWSKGLVKSDGISVYNEQEIKANTVLKDLDVNKYLILKYSDKFQSAILKDYAFINAKYDKLVALDDDHPFIYKNSLKLYYKYLTKYDYVKGRILNPEGQPHLFFSRYVNPTNIGFLKSLYIKSKGFPNFIYENSYGEDNVLVYLFYKELNYTITKKKASFAGEIVTKDLVSNRWRDRSNYNISEFNNTKYKRDKAFIEDFIKTYGVHPYTSNPSRIKLSWMEFPSFVSLLSEIKYMSIYSIYTPKILINIINRVANLVKRNINDKKNSKK